MTVTDSMPSQVRIGPIRINIWPVFTLVPSENVDKLLRFGNFTPHTYLKSVDDNVVGRIFTLDFEAKMYEYMDKLRFTFKNVTQTIDYHVEKPVANFTMCASTPENHTEVASFMGCVTEISNKFLRDYTIIFVEIKDIFVDVDCNCKCMTCINKKRFLYFRGKSYNKVKCTKFCGCVERLINGDRNAPSSEIYYHDDDPGRELLG